jgi:hypothetical protein
MKTRQGFEYPKEQAYRGGCKVSWLTYDKREDAEEASRIAISERDHLWGLGYDFGWCLPGEIVETSGGKFVVTVP